MRWCTLTYEKIHLISKTDQHMSDDLVDGSEIYGFEVKEMQIKPPLFVKFRDWRAAWHLVALNKLQCFQKKYTSEFWSVCCNCSKMNCQYLLREKKRGRIQCSTHEIFSSWSSYNIFFKILRYTSSENTVATDNNWEAGEKSRCHEICFLNDKGWMDTWTCWNVLQHSEFIQHQI